MCNTSACVWRIPDAHICGHQIVRWQRVLLLLRKRKLVFPKIIPDRMNSKTEKLSCCLELLTQTSGKQQTSLNLALTQNLVAEPDVWGVPTWKTNQIIVRVHRTQLQFLWEMVGSREPFKLETSTVQNRAEVSIPWQRQLHVLQNTRWWIWCSCNHKNQVLLFWPVGHSNPSSQTGESYSVGNSCWGSHIWLHLGSNKPVERHWCRMDLFV